MTTVREVGWLAGALIGTALVIAPALTMMFVLLGYDIFWLKIIEGGMLHEFPSWAFWRGAGIIALEAFFSLWFGAALSNLIAPRYDARDWLKLAYLLLTVALFVWICIWNKAFADTYLAGCFLVGMWEEQLQTYWDVYADGELSRETGQRKPRDSRRYPRRLKPLPKYPLWVGEVRGADINHRYELWQGFRTALFTMSKFMGGKEKLGSNPAPLGNARVASVEDTYKAGL